MIPRITEARGYVRVSEMEPGAGWIDRRMLGGETDPDIIRMKVVGAQQALANLEVLNFKGLACPRPS